MEIAYITILVLIASMVGTMTGFGTSTIMVPVLLLFYAVPQTLLFVGIIHWFGNLWKMLFFRSGLRWRLILCFGIPGIVASYFGASLVPDVPKELLRRILGGVMVGYVVFLLVKGSFKLKQSIRSGICGGALSGFLAGIFGIVVSFFANDPVLASTIRKRCFIGIGIGITMIVAWKIYQKYSE